MTTMLNIHNYGEIPLVAPDKYDVQPKKNSAEDTEQDINGNENTISQYHAGRRVSSLRSLRGAAQYAAIENQFSSPSLERQYNEQTHQAPSINDQEIKSLGRSPFQLSPLRPNAPTSSRSNDESYIDEIATD